MLKNLKDVKKIGFQTANEQDQENLKSLIWNVRK